MRSILHVLLGLLLLGLAVQATHFRYSNIQWVQSPGTRTITFTITSAWRRDFRTFRIGNGNAGVFSVGDNVTEPNIFFRPTTTSSAAADSFVFRMRVNSISPGATSFTNVVQNWFIGVFTVTYAYGNDANGVPITFPTAAFDNCCRISTLKNNPDGRFRVETKLTVLNGRNRRGLEVTMLPIVTLARGIPRTFPVTVIALNDSDVTAVRYRLATAAEAGGSNYRQAIDDNGVALSVDYNTGLVSWTPGTIGAYSTQIIVEGFNSSSSLITSHAIDFILDVVAPSPDNAPPVFISFTSTSSLTPTVSTNLTIQSDGNYRTSIPLGGTLTLRVTAQDPNAVDFVTVGSGAIPTGAVATPTVANTGFLTFVWTPTATQLGSIVCFTASDSRGLSAIANPCVTISVVSPDLFAEGIGLTYAVAGDETTVFIHNADARNHSLTIIGGGNTASAVIVNTKRVSPRNPNQVIYNATYNRAGVATSFVTKSGFYALTIKDETPGQNGLLLYTLRVVPSVTSAPNCDPYDFGSSGLTGGKSLADVFFFVQSQDRFDNDVTENRSPSGTNVETMEADVIFKNSTTLATGVYQSEGIWRIAYKIPSNNEEANYTLSIYLKRVVGGTRTLVRTFNPTIQPLEFVASIFTHSPYVAGQNVRFEIRGTSSNHRWTASVLGAVIPAANFTIPSGSPFFYNFSAPPVYRAGSYVNGISATAPGLESERLVSSFEVVPDAPFGPKCVVLAGTADARAGETTSVVIQLYDVYDNLIRFPTSSTVVSFTLTHSVEGTRAGTATWNGFTFTYSFSYKYDFVGDLSIDVQVQSGSSAPQAIASSPYAVTVEPADFSVSRSRTGYAGSFAAGDSSSMNILARDAFNNERTEGNDEIKASFSLLGSTPNYTYTAQPELGTNRYSFSYTATKAGTYEVVLQAYIPQEFSFVPFTTEKVIVTPGPVVPANTGISGDGWKETSLSAGSSQQVLSQAKDGFQNVVTEKREVLFVAKVTSGTTSTYFASSYVEPLGGTCVPSASSSYVLQNLQSGTISAAEQLLAADGYHKLSYTVPSASGRYTVELSLCNSTKAEGILNPKDILDTGCDSVGSQVLSSNAQQTSFSFADNYGAIAGTAIGGAVALGGLFYVGWRLHRYRPKYLAEKKRAEEAQKELEEIGKEVDIIPAHGDDDIAPPKDDEVAPEASKTGTLKGVPQTKEQVEVAADVKMEVSRPQIRKEFAPSRPAAKTEAGFSGSDVDPIAGAKSL